MGAWRPVSWAIDCGGKIQVAEPEVVEQALPPLVWDPCNTTVPCQQWRVLHDKARQAGPLLQASVYAKAKQVGVALEATDYRYTAAYDFVTGRPLVAWRAPSEGYCNVYTVRPAGDVVWAGAFDLDQFEDSSYVRFDLATKAELTVPFRSPSYERLATPTMLLADTNGGVTHWSVGDAESIPIGELGTSRERPNITAHGIYYRKREPQSTAPPEVWHWDPATKVATLVALPPPGMGVLHVRATDGRLWWTAAQLNPDGPGFSQIQLFTAPLPIPQGSLPITGTFVRDLSLGALESVSSDTQFAYGSRDPNINTIRIVSLNGTELELPMVEATDVPLGMLHLGSDNQLDNALWYETYTTIYRLEVPPGPPGSP